MASTQASIKDHVHITEVTEGDNYYVTGKIGHTIRKTDSRQAMRQYVGGYEEAKKLLKQQVIRDCWHPFHNETYTQIQYLMTQIRRDVPQHGQAILLELCQDMLKTLDRPE